MKKSQELFNKKNELSLIEIAARCYDCPIEEIVRQTSSKLPGAKVTAIKQTIESKMTAIHRFEHFSLGISAVILVISLLIVFTNVNASVNERTKEIGIFMSVGFRRWHIIKIILLEVLIASFSAGVIGFFIGIAGAKIITPILSMDDSITINFSYSLLLLSAGMAVTAGLLASVLPALKAARLDPTVAFRSL
ncbi:MAG: FtsX-like permease family protein [Ignavibacteriaceae bacterium]|nr:FtsX-like permease family protein [Ignavibacteriaceae bacterium]